MSLTAPLPPDLDLTGLIRKVGDYQDRWTATWHGPEQVKRPASNFAMLVQEQHRYNFDLWHEEDKARAPGATDAQLAEVKRAIDRLNQKRNDYIEQLDDAIVIMLAQRRIQTPEEAPWNTETPGSAIDRLSIVSLRIYHMREQEGRADVKEDHRDKCRAKREILERQRADLIAALQTLVDDLFQRRKQMKVYRIYKMYNDPALNPEIYKAGGQAKA